MVHIHKSAFAPFLRFTIGGSLVAAENVVETSFWKSSKLDSQNCWSILLMALKKDVMRKPSDLTGTVIIDQKKAQKPSFIKPHSKKAEAWCFCNEMWNLSKDFYQMQLFKLMWELRCHHQELKQMIILSYLYFVFPNFLSQ